MFIKSNIGIIEDWIMEVLFLLHDHEGQNHFY